MGGSATFDTGNPENDWMDASYLCDHCGEEIVIPVDYSAGSRQEYTEDCPVCCHPIHIHLQIDDDGEVSSWGEAEQDHQN